MRETSTLSPSEIAINVYYYSFLPLIVGGMVAMIVSWRICGPSKIDLFHIAAMSANMFLLIDDVQAFLGSARSLAVTKVAVGLFLHIIIPPVNLLLIFWLCANIKWDWRKPKLMKQKNSVNDW